MDSNNVTYTTTTFTVEEPSAKVNILQYVILPFVAYLLYSFFVVPQSALNRFLQSTGWGGKRERWFPDLRARIASVKNTRAMVSDGYAQLNKSHKPFLMSRLIGSPILVLPPDTIHTMLQKPDNEVDIKLFLKQALQSYHTGFLSTMDNDFHFDVIRHQLTRKLPLLTAAVYEELILAFEDQWGTDRVEWKKVPVYGTVMRVTSRAANRIFCGPDLCRNAEFLEACREFTQELFKAGALLNMVPAFLRSVVAPFLVAKKDKQLKIAKRHLLPVINQRLQELRNGAPHGQTNDGIQWILEESFKYGPEEQDMDLLALRVVILNMVAIHTTSITITNTILDLYSSPNSAEFVEGLQEEVGRVLARNGGEFTKVAVNDLLRVDSAIKESMRFSSLGSISVNRTVVAKDGIDLPNGIHVPPGVHIAAASSAIHRDSSFYPEPDTYDAFRFSAPREQELEAKTVRAEAKDTEPAKPQPLKNQSLINTQDTFLSFGHGRHACPGRFFASQELKLMLAHIVTHYDIKPLKRPETIHFGAGGMPDPTFEIELRMK